MGLIDVTEFHLRTEEEQIAKVKELLSAVARPRAKLDGTEGTFDRPVAVGGDGQHFARRRWRPR